MNNYEKEKAKWYNEIYNNNKPTLWYQMPSKYID